MAAAAAGGGWDAHVHVFDARAPVRAGHYLPAQRPLADIEALASAHGVRHLVLVQPSVYGSDNRLLLQALQAEPGRHRGVVVLDDDVEGAQLDRLHEAGVRGVRMNLVSPVGEDGADASTRFAALAPRLRTRGWHLQWYADAAQLDTIARLHQGSGVVAVLDHLAGLHAGLPADDPAWAALQRLADAGAWVKLSGWYRLRCAEPYAELLPLVQRVAALFGERLVWGSDWPHTHFAPQALPAYASTWRPVQEALGPARAAALHGAAAALYG